MEVRRENKRKREEFFRSLFFFPPSFSSLRNPLAASAPLPVNTRRSRNGPAPTRAFEVDDEEGDEGKKKRRRKSE